jgi:hypothetical protein
MSQMVKKASRGEVFMNRDNYVHFSGNRVREVEGSQINDMHKNLLANVNVADMSNQEIIDFYSTNIHPYIPYDTSYAGMDMMGNGQNIVDMLQNMSANPRESYYVPGENAVISGKDINKRLNHVKSYMYQYFLNKSESDPLSQLNSVHEYILRTIQPYIKVSDDFKVTNNQKEMTTPNTRFPSMPIAKNEVRRSGYNPMTSAQKAAPTFLNNLEKILRIKPSNAPRAMDERNAFFDRFGG